MFSTRAACKRMLLSLIGSALCLFAMQPAAVGQSVIAKFRAGLQCTEGDSLVRQGKYREAIILYDRAIELNPKMAYAHFARGYALYLLDDLDGAIESYGRAIALDPNDDAAYLNRGLVRLRVGYRSEALADIDKAIELDPREAMYYFKRGAAKLYLGRDNDAMQDFRRAIEMKPALKPTVEKALPVSMA